MLQAKSESFLKLFSDFFLELLLVIGVEDIHFIRLQFVLHFEPLLNDLSESEVGGSQR